MGVEIDILSRTWSGTGYLTSKHAYHLTGNSPSGNLSWRNSQVGEEDSTHTVRSLLGGWNAAKGRTASPQGLGRAEERKFGRFPRGGRAGGESKKTGGEGIRGDGRTEVRERESTMQLGTPAGPWCWGQEKRRIS